MGEDVAMECQKLAVHAVSFVYGKGRMFYSSIPCSTETQKGCGTHGAGEKFCPVSSLWDHLVAMESPFWKPGPSSNKAVFPIQVVRGLLGRPHLLLGDYQGPAISFSEVGG
jgi:hypothetical protein